MIISEIDDFFCNFINVDGVMECSKCGNIIEVLDDNDEPVLWPCSSPLKSSNLANDIQDFMRPTLGSELCDESSIDYRHSICKSCDHFKNNSCDKCGCAISKDRNYLNKLAAKNETCPLAKW